MIIFFYLILATFGFLIPIGIAIFGIFAILGDLKGAPYVPTNKKLLQEILEDANLKKGQRFLELGSGDGRVTLLAVREFGVVGEGIEIHPLLVLYSNILAKWQKLDARFKTGDFYKLNLGKTDVIFVFLLPNTLKKLAPKFLKECKKGTLIITHGFKIAGLEKNLIKTQKRKLFSTYFYHI